MLLEIRDLSVRIGPYQIVSIEELDLAVGQRLGIVGESGSGKTMTAMSIVGLQPRDAKLTGSIVFDGTELVGLSESKLADLRGRAIGVVFQDPLRALNPTMRVGRQVGEVLRLHLDLSRSEIKARVLELLSQVQLPRPEEFVRRYPHQLSGGQQQRVMIAMAIACGPKLLIADEPTTALDVTVQKGILELIARLSDEHDMAVLFVSHNLGVIKAISDEVAVVYGGHVVESGPTETVVERSHHRYTDALIGANPGHSLGDEGIEARIGQRLEIIRGSVPPLGGFPSGCRFRGRCEFEIDQCAEDPPIFRGDDGHRHKCWNPAEDSATEGAR
jgi:peptide/nickel transport system ATP-binding protein